VKSPVVEKDAGAEVLFWRVHVVDELPDAAKIESPYGTLQATWAVKDGKIVMDESLEIKGIVAPASEYPQIRDFFERVNGAQSAPVVLVKQ